MGHREVQSVFPSFHYGVISEFYKVKLIQKKAVYWQCGGTYKGLCRQNVSRVVGQRYSVGEDGQKRYPLTGTHPLVAAP